MNCRGVYRRLSAYIDSDLSPGIKEGVEEHLQNCPACAKRLEELRAIVDAAHSLPTLKVGEGFEERVLTAVRSKHTLSEVLGNVRYRLTLAGVAFMVTAAAIFFVIGPPASKVDDDMAVVDDSLQTGKVIDYTQNPQAIVYEFPIPENGVVNSNPVNEKITPVDSMARPDVFILPNIQKVSENVDGKF
jgi:hypothetical protein